MDRERQQMIAYMDGMLVEQRRIRRQSNPLRLLGMIFLWALGAVLGLAALSGAGWVSNGMPGWDR